MKKLLCLLLVPAIIFLASCSASNSREGTRQKYQNYKEIPGVTQEEIDALDSLLAERPHLVYGICVSTEAFLYEDGSVGGFASLFCDRMSELFGFEFDFYPCNWDELNEKIVAKEIDLVGDFTPTPERLRKFFMTDSVIQRTIKIFTDINSDSLSVTAKTRPIRCAFMKGSTTYSLVADSWNLQFTPVFIDDESSVPDLFLSGEIDAFIEEGTLEAAYIEYDFIKADEYYPLTYSPVSLTTGNPEMAPLISVMGKYLNSGGSYELTEIYNEGYKEYLKYKLSINLTDEEKEYIARHNSAETAVPAACKTEDYPSSFYNKIDNEFQGAAIDVLNSVTDLTGIVFKIENGPDAHWPELLEGLENGKYSIVSQLIRSTQRQGRFLWSDQPCYEDSYALISKVDYPDVDINQVLFAKIGLLKDTAYADVFNEWFPDSVNTVVFTTNDEAFRALEKGNIDLLMASQNFLLHLKNYLENPSYKANIVFRYPSDSFIGFNKNEELLCSIVSKAMRYINVEETAIRWQQKGFDYKSKMFKDMFPYLIIFVVVLSAGLFAVVFLLVKNRRIGRNLERLVEKRTSELEFQTSTLSSIFESIPDIIFCKDLDLRYTQCNPRFEKHFGCTRADIIGKDDAEALGLPFEIYGPFLELDRKIMRERQPSSVEEMIPAADGTTPLFETIKTPLIQDGEVVGIMGIARDITQRKAAEETLKLTLDNLNTCIYISEIETGKILFINEKMSNEFGSEDLHGKICWEVLQDGFTERCEFCPIPKLIESGDEYYVWEEHNTVTGKHYKNTDSLIKWHDGRLVHMQHSVDISDSVKLQQELEHASKAKSDFLSRMSHEIRTPLNAIIGMNSIAINTDDLVKIRHCHDRIDNASKHLLGLINDILDMSKIEADKFELFYSELNFEKMLMSVTNVINFRADEKRQNIVVDLNENVPAFIIGDELRLSQVITNLLTNAVKFTPENGTIVLSIEKESGTPEDFTLKFEVADNGIGISEEQQKRLFTSFEQADGSISRRFGGTGLGLAISKRIVELMGGSIWVESEPGHGSKFIFTIKTQKGKEKTIAKLSPKINMSNIRILAVDDCAEIREYFSYVMSAHNLPCDVASSGPEALDKIQNCGDKPYNIFFVDWQMPEMDGIELTRRITALTGGNCVVIMISVSDWNNIEKEAVSAGVKQFIPKPLFPSALINTINECLGANTQKSDGLYDDGAERNIRNLGNHTILIAEDIEVNREIMAAILEDTGLSIDFAENGKVAVSMFKENPDKYSLILMDIHMPEMDGYASTRMMRGMESPWAKDIPIIAMTANVFREDIENCLAAGMNGHIGKPVDQDDLFAKLVEYLPHGTASAKKAVADTSGGSDDIVAGDRGENPPVINMTAALGRFRNNKELYFKLLKNFDGKTMADEIINSVNDSDTVKTAQAAHALKGAASNLGLDEIAKAASDIEARAKAGIESRQMLDSLNRAMSAAADAIASLLKDET